MSNRTGKYAGTLVVLSWRAGGTVCRLATGVSTLSTESLLLSVRTLIAADLAVIEQLLFEVIILSGNKSVSSARSKIYLGSLYTLNPPLIIKLAPVMVSRFELAK